MQARDLFGVALRVLGLWLLYQALDDARWLVFRLVGIVRDSPLSPPNQDSMPLYKISIAFYLVLALVLLFCADRITRFFYGPAGTATPE